MDSTYGFENLALAFDYRENNEKGNFAVPPLLRFPRMPTLVKEIMSRNELGAKGYILADDGGLYLTVVAVGPIPRVPELNEPIWNSLELEPRINRVIVYLTVDRHLKVVRLNLSGIDGSRLPEIDLKLHRFVDIELWCPHAIGCGSYPTCEYNNPSVIALLMKKCINVSP